jgi:hypothetical protein
MVVVIFFFFKMIFVLFCEFTVSTLSNNNVFFFLIDIKGKDVNARHVGMVISSVKRIRKHGFYS